MKTTPHTHKPRLYRQFTFIVPGDWRLEYGDQDIHVCHGWFGHNPRPDQVKQALSKAVEQHDQESLKAVKSREAFAQEINNSDLFLKFSAPATYTPGLRFDKTEWGSEILKEKENVTSNR